MDAANKHNATEIGIGIPVVALSTFAGKEYRTDSNTGSWVRELVQDQLPKLIIIAYSNVLMYVTIVIADTRRVNVRQTGVTML